MAFKLGPKILIVNNAEQAPILFYSKFANGTKRLVETDDDYQTTTAFDDLVATPDTQSGAEGPLYSPANVTTDNTIAQADFLRIYGFADFDRANVLEAIGSKSVPGVKQISTITFTVPGALTTASIGKDIIVNIRFISSNFESEFASYSSNYIFDRSYIITVKAGDTPTTLATKLINQINAQVDDGSKVYLTATSAAGVVTITSERATLTQTVTFTGEAYDSGEVSAAFAVTTAGYEGRGTWEQLKGIRLETHYGAYVESAWADQVPLKSGAYSLYRIIQRISRPDLAGLDGTINTVPVGDFEYWIFVNQSLTSYITDLTQWLNANVANRTMYTSTTAAGVLGGDPSTTATTVDASEPFTTPLV